MAASPLQSRHGPSPGDLARFARIQGLLNERSIQALRLEPGQRVLEVGAGLGHLACLMARQVGTSGQVVGMEAHPRQLELAQRRAMSECPAQARPDIRAGDGVDPPLGAEEWGAFDVAHARFQLQHVTQQAAVVTHMLEAVRPGGRIVLEDDDHADLMLSPEPPATMQLWRAYMEIFSVIGHDPRVGRDLVRLAVRAGARPRRAECLSFSGCAGDDRFPVLHEYFVGLMRGAREAIVECGLLSTTEIDAGIRELEEWGRRDDAALWYATCWIEATRPES